MRDVRKVGKSAKALSELKDHHIGLSIAHDYLSLIERVSIHPDAFLDSDLDKIACRVDEMVCGFTRGTVGPVIDHLPALTSGDDIRQIDEMVHELLADPGFGEYKYSGGYEDPIGLGTAHEALKGILAFNISVVTHFVHRHLENFDEEPEFDRTSGGECETQYGVFCSYCGNRVEDDEIDDPLSQLLNEDEGKCYDEAEVAEPVNTAIMDVGLAASKIASELDEWAAGRQTLHLQYHLACAAVWTIIASLARQNELRITAVKTIHHYHGLALRPRIEPEDPHWYEKANGMFEERNEGLLVALARWLSRSTTGQQRMLASRSKGFDEDEL